MHRSTTDAEARLNRKGDGQPAYLPDSAHAITENHHWLVMAVEVDQAERRASGAMLDDLERRGVHPATPGVDKGYDDGAFITRLEQRGDRPTRGDHGRADQPGD